MITMIETDQSHIIEQKDDFIIRELAHDEAINLIESIFINKIELASNYSHTNNRLQENSDVLLTLSQNDDDYDDDDDNISKWSRSNALLNSFPLIENPVFATPRQNNNGASNYTHNDSISITQGSESALYSTPCKTDKNLNQHISSANDENKHPNIIIEENKKLTESNTKHSCAHDEFANRCAICLSPLKETTYITSCQHRFHHECLIEHRGHSNRSCPLCREALPRGLTPLKPAALRTKYALLSSHYRPGTLVNQTRESPNDTVRSPHTTVRNSSTTLFSVVSSSVCIIS